MNVKQVIVIRLRFPDAYGNFRKCRTGKYVAQAAHAAMKVFLDRGIVSGDQLTITITPEMAFWIDGAFTKICLSVETEEELLEVYKKATEAGLPCALITDSGKTEFGGIPTHTAVAIGPADSDEINRVTGHLPLC